MYYCLLRELVYHLNLNYTKFRLASLEVSSTKADGTKKGERVACESVLAREEGGRLPTSSRGKNLGDSNLC